jgi:hypothetical protein
MGNGPFPRNRRKLLKIERTKTSGKVVGYELFEEMEIEMTDELDPEDPKFDSKKRKYPLYKVQLQLEGYLQELPQIGRSLSGMLEQIEILSRTCVLVHSILLDLGLSVGSSMTSIS